MKKEYIEKNIDLIDNSRWEKFFKHAPKGCGGVLYEAGLDFLEELDYIPDLAFYGANIQTIDIPDNVKSIGNAAFCDCSSLTNVTIGEGVESIGYSAFRICDRLKNVTIGSGVTNIGVWAFAYCNNIKITYNGTKDEWAMLTDGKDIFKETNYTCTCTDGIVNKLE